ncbi:MAG: PilZ domain-containing protein, partial [Isosphaeraceae bacterium]
MPRNDRRNAHRYALARDKIRLGWWQGQHFPTISARLRNLSVSGALVQLEEGAVGPAGVKAWICLADQSATHWVQAEVVGVCPELPETPCVVRLKFLDAFPYESFKTAVWDDG